MENIERRVLHQSQTEWCPDSHESSRGSYAAAKVLRSHRLAGRDVLDSSFENPTLDTF